MAIALETVTLSRSAYNIWRFYLALPSIRTLQNAFSSSEKLDVSTLLQNLSPFQNFILLNIDEIYMKPSLRFSGGQIHG